jgi:hypothetical protein
MNFSSMYGLRPADRIIENIFPTGISKHHVIYLGMDDNGTEWVVANIIIKGVKKMRAADYFARVKKFKIQHFVGEYPDRVEAVKRALDKLGEPYNLIRFNCEHYAEYVQTGRSSSMQVENVFKSLALAGLGLLLIAIINNISND